MTDPGSAVSDVIIVGAGVVGTAIALGAKPATKSCSRCARASPDSSGA